MAAKRPRYSKEPDLEVLVEDEVFPVHSVVLMCASDVFAQMLETNMSESKDGVIRLVDKKKEEFREVLKHLDIKGGQQQKIDRDNVHTLLAWADEYQIEGLKSRCKAFLGNTWGMKRTDVLDLALKYGLTEIRDRVAKELASSIFDHRNDISKYFDQNEVVKHIVPALRKEFGITASTDGTDEGVSVRAFWCILEKAMEERRMLRQGWPSVDQTDGAPSEFTYYKNRSRSLYAKLKDLVPKSECGVLPDKKWATMEEVQEGVGESFAESEIDDMLTRWVQRGNLKRKRVNGEWRFAQDWLRGLP